jgi:hypothetical protein
MMFLYPMIAGVLISYLSGIATGILAVYIPLQHTLQQVPIAQRDSKQEEKK